jgi:hypothetical protein
MAWSDDPKHPDNQPIPYQLTKKAKDELAKDKGQKFQPKSKDGKKK